MKVLIIEDVTEKARAIASAVEESGVAAENIQIVPDLQQAKRTLSETQVSLLLLDLRIPARFDRSPHLSGGTDLLEWIEREEGLHKPAVTVAVSAAEVTESVRRDLASRGVVFVTYEPSNTTWREFLVSFIHRLHISAGSLVSAPVRPNEDVPVAILTSVDIELRHAKRIFHCDREPVIRGGVSWYRSLAEGALMPPIVVAKAPQMGMQLRSSFALRRSAFGGLDSSLWWGFAPGSRARRSWAIS